MAATNSQDAYSTPFQTDNPERGKRRKDEEELEEEEEIEPSLEKWVEFPHVMEIGETLALPPIDNKSCQIIQLIKEMEEGYKVEIATFQDKIKEKDAIIVTFTQINEEILVVKYPPVGQGQQEQP